MPYSTILAFIIFGLSQTACATSEVSEIIKSNFEPLITSSHPKEERRQSMTVAIVTPKETEMFFLGELSEAGERPNELTVFEIGSLTKGYLGLLIAKASIDGMIKLDSPIPKKFQPSKSKMQPITWRQLANQTSGLPRLPSNLNVTHPLQPYRDYDLQDMLSYLSNFISTIEPGKVHDYSNFGAGVAGEALSEVYGKSLDEIFTEMIAKPNHLTDTTVFLEDHQKQRQSPVFLNGQKVKPWKWLPSSSLQGAAALKSTISNSVNMMKTMMAIHGGDTVPYVDLATTPSFEITPNRKIGLFWNYEVGPNIIWHNGGTAGSSSFFGYDPDSLVGIVVLSNSLIIKDGSLDPRLDLAAFKALNELKAELGSSKALALLKRYDIEVARQNTKFKQLETDLNDPEWIKTKLTHMYDVDQYMRSYSSSEEVLALSERDRKFFDIGFLKRWFLLDRANTEDMKTLLDKYEWFKVSEWGKDLDNKAWLLVQHADHDFEFQTKVLSVLEGLLASKETSPKNYAYLFDRIAVSDKNPKGPQLQRYGTQGHCVGPGKWEPRPIENPKQVDQRRLEVGLQSLEEYKKLFVNICH